MTNFPYVTVSSLQDLRAIPEAVTALKGIGLGDDEAAFITELRSLKLLDLSGCEALTDASVTLLSSLRDLESLDLSLCNQITDRSLASLATLPKLRAINLNWCYSISDSGIESLSHCKTLEKVSLWSCEEITDVGVQALAQFPRLLELDLPEFAHITDRGILALSLSAAPIEYLRLDHLSEITDGGLVQLSKLRGLRQLKIWHCPNISMAAIEQLRIALPAIRIDSANADKATGAGAPAE
jgi:Leucine-rich repeat (LRR) protein